MSVLSPRTIDEALSILSSDTSATLLAGGTDLMVEINLHDRRPSSVVSLSRIDELKRYDVTDEFVTIGSAVPYADMERGTLADLLPALAQAARTVGSPQIRAAGTLGGNLGTCSPAGDGLPVIAALDAVIDIVSSSGERHVPFGEFMTGVKRNSLAPGEIIRSISFPRRNGWQGYAKVGSRNAMVIATASLCLTRSSTAVTVALGAVGPTIIRALDAEAWIAAQCDLSRPIAPDVAREFAERVAQSARPIDDHRSTAAYRRHAVRVLALRLLERSDV
ncbi:MAG: FAD binding domain-containing protein [Actinomycetota bacterium]|nr:FAD binding domain-containing protein [Actinomycetota bacterium]MDA2971296.1 FAD binding domain-containing protein [Actinomycetota bacterium]MDA3001723.1 FAD binding domain-containing protein [Actinomycetota bacterium]